MRTSLFCLIVVLSACTKTEVDTRDAEAKAIKDVEAAWVKSAAAKDADAFVAFFTNDASVLSPNAPILTGKEAIKEGVKPMLSDPNFSLLLVPTHVEVAKSSDLAFSQGTYKMTFSDLRGAKFDDEGKYLTVWRKLPDGSWKAVEETMNSDLPLPPPPQ